MSDRPELERFRQLLRIPTVSGSDAFPAFHAELARLYPRVHEALELEVVAEHALLYRWRGASADSPTVLMAHQDVVPAGADGWTHPPFDAVLEDVDGVATLWGRGTIDDKGMLVALLEAVDAALADGVVPADDVYLAFGHDEETGGTGGRALADLLHDRGVEPGLVLDEGGAIVQGVFPGIDRRLAVIGVSEKGIASVELLVAQQGGHASTPPAMTAPTRLARAILRISNRPAPASLPEPSIEMLEALAPHARGPQAFAFRRARRFRRRLVRIFERLGPETAAIVRTTRAVTRLSGSDGDNVLAERATAIVNLRVAVDSSLDEAVEQLRDAVDDPEVAIRVTVGSEPSPVSPSSGPAWDALTAAVAEVHPDAVPTPYVMLAASDARWFARTSRNVYRFSPFEISAEERAALHAIDERIRVDAWLDGIRVFRALIGRL